MTGARDRAFMEMAYGLAAAASGRVSPNPLVGAVVVRRGAIVGHGHHEGPGTPHAEALAVDRAGRKARGATLYVTLEPCVHWGHTPPCVDAVLAAGLGRVVVSSLDPNPLVHGKGVRKLRRAGLDVQVGLLAAKNARLNEAYAAHIVRRRPFVTLKAALSLDGKLATRGRDSRWISGREARAYMHLVRAEQDAVMVGVRTVLADDPLLTVRPQARPGKRLARIVLDPRLRTSPEARLLRTLDRGPVIVFCAPTASAGRRRALEAMGAEVVAVPAGPGGLDLRRVLARLGRRGIASVLVEGGGRLATSVLEARLADKLLVSLSPLLIGGRDAVSLFGGRGAARLRDALRLRGASARRFGGDLIVEGYL